MLNIDFSALAADGGINRPKVSAIEILSSTATNTPPTANAGSDQTITLPTSSVTLNGSGTDPDGSIKGYSWTKVSGPSQGTITSPSLASTTVNGLVQGTYTFRLTVTDNLGATGSDDVVVTVNAATTTTAAYQINSGGPQLNTSMGTFAADNYFSPIPGYTFSTTQAISGTGDPALYQTERSSTTDNGTFSYAFPVNNGTYTVILHFAEIYFTAVNKRVFDVSIENVKVLDNYDIYKKVGAFTATTESFSTNVTDGVLNIYFSALASDGGINRPKISAIQILSNNNTTNTSPTANAGQDQTITLPTNSTTLNGSGTDSDGSITAYNWTKVSGPSGSSFGSPSSATTTVNGLVQGTYTFRLTVTDNQGATGSDDVVVTVNPPTEYRINSGGPQLTTSIGTFAADNYFSPSPGFTFSTTTAIAGTTDDALYQTERSSTQDNGTFSYAFPVSNGTYTVVLHFAEIYFTAVNKRVFDVSIENVKVLDNYDIFKKVGGFTATTETFTTTVNDGMLNIDFSAKKKDGGIYRPEVTAIEVLNPSANPSIIRTNMPVNSLLVNNYPNMVYPNPTKDGRFNVLFPEEMEGEIGYSLISVSGNELTKGKLTLIRPTPVVEFDFSQPMQKAGMYYLWLKNKNREMVFKVIIINE
jgi:hypothetical protein